MGNKKAGGLGEKMQIKIIQQTSRSVVIELIDGGIYHTIETYRILLNKKEYVTTNKVINGIYELKPDTEYEICVQGKEVEEKIIICTEKESFSLNVKDFGAKGDGINDDTCCIQAAIMACPPNGRVYIPKGVYCINSLFLKSNVRIELGKDAVLKAFTDRSLRPIMPGRISNYEETESYYLGTWEGNPVTMFSGIIQGLHVENVVIYGQGCIDGNASLDNWWKNPKDKEIAWRPRLLFLGHCKNVVVEGIEVKNSPSWTIHPYFCEDMKFINLSIKNPSYSPNTDALDPESCKNVEITGIHFSVGDDCIAIKSGKIYMGKTFKTPSEKIVIRQCCMRDGHGSVTIGSECAGGIKEITVKDCLFIDTDRGLRIKTRRGRGKDAVLDGITFKRIRMDGVLTPITINCFYFCDPDGHTPYVQTKESLEIDERTPVLKKFVFEDMECKNCHTAASFIYGLPESKIEEITMKNVQISFAKNAKKGYPEMLDGIEAVSKMGMWIKNVNRLKLEQVQIEDEVGEKFILENINQ